MSRESKQGCRRVKKNNVNTVRIIGGRLRRRQITFPSLGGLRPTSDRIRETLFNWLGQELDGLVCLDLFAGSGALGFEAVSRGAARVVMVEKDKSAAHSLRQNQQSLSATEAEIHHADALGYLQHTAEQFDLILLDPPFLLDLLPVLLPLAREKLKPGGLLYVEAGSLPDLDGWYVYRQGRGGAVHYLLLEMQEPAL